LRVYFLVYFREFLIFLMKLFIGHKQGVLAPQILVGFFFQGAPRKNADLKKKVNKNYKGQVPLSLSKQKISTSQADLKKRKVMMVGDLRLPWREGSRGKNPT
jgi:hypothetical protein